MRYDTWLSEAMPRPKRKFVDEEKVWDDLRAAILETVKRLKAHMIEEAKGYS